MRMLKGNYGKHWHNQAIQPTLVPRAADGWRSLDIDLTQGNDAAVGIVVQNNAPCADTG